MNRKRTLMALSVCLLVAMLVTSCAPAAQTPVPPTKAPASQGSQPTAAPAAGKRGTLLHSIYWEPPVKNGIYESSEDMSWFFDKLIRIDYDGTIVPRLAEKWQYSADGKEWTFNLRKNAKWHDGVTFTADDVVFTCAKILDPKIASPLYDYLTVGGKPIQVQKVDDNTVKFILPEAYGPFLVNLSYIFMAPKHALENVADMQNCDFNKRPVGTGPFKVKEIVEGDHWTLEANDDFYLGKPGLAGAYIRITGSTEAIVAALKTGEQHEGETEEITDLDWFKQQGGYTIYTTTPGGVTYLWLNALKEPLLQDVRVRQAMVYAINRQAIVDTVTYGYAKVSDSPIVPKGAVAWASDPNVPKYPYDVEKAKSLLKGAGWADANNDGVLEKDGKPFRFTVWGQSGYATYENTLVAAQADLKKVGIAMEIQLQEKASFSALRRDPTRADKAQAMLTGSSVPNDPDEIYSLFHSSTYPNGGNIFGYSNPKVDKALAQGRITVNPDQRKPLYFEAQDLVMQDVPGIPLYYYWIGWVVNNKLKGLPTPEQLSGVDPTYYIGAFGERLSLEP